MTEAESRQFIEVMEKKGDYWTQEDVMQTYSGWEYEEALKDRNKKVDELMESIVKALERSKEARS
ncbi:MAG: hypothetical protein LIO37_03830 [Clostridiales bacterium]|nr:hypothetical protein [Clostridiales bacterium]